MVRSPRPARSRWVVAAWLIAAMAVPASPAAAHGVLETSIADVEAVWLRADDGRAYPELLAYTGRATMHSEEPTILAGDLWGTERRLELTEVDPQAAPDALSQWRLTGSVRPIKLQLLNDAGVEFRVAELAPFGTDVHFGQTALGDLRFWAAAAAGSQAVDGNRNEQLVVNDALPVVFPDREPSAGEGTLAWRHASALRSAASAAWDPSTQSFLSTSLVSAVATPTLTVTGGDLTQPAQAETLAVDLPEDVDPFGSLMIYPTGMPGVAVNLTSSFPDAATRDFHRMRVSASVDPVAPWPETRLDGPLLEWGYRPLILNYGWKRSAGSVGGAATLRAPVPPGSVVLARSVTGELDRLGPTTSAAVVEITNVEGDQELRLIHGGPPAATASIGSTKSLASADGSADSTAGGGGGGSMSSPSLRGLLGPGLVHAGISERDSVRVIDDLVAGATEVGDLAVPGMRVDGSSLRLDRSVVTGGIHVTPVSFGNASGSFYGTGLEIRARVAHGGVAAELAVVPVVSNLGTTIDLYVLDVHSIDGSSHVAEVTWYSRPVADRFTANGQEIPREIVTHEEMNGGFGEFNAPDIVAIGGSNPDLRYFLLSPVLISQLDPNGATGSWALVRDQALLADGLSQVNGDQLRGSVALYARQPIMSTLTTEPTYYPWLRLQPA